MPEINQTVFIHGGKNFNHNKALNSFHAAMETFCHAIFTQKNVISTRKSPFFTHFSPFLVILKDFHQKSFMWLVVRWSSDHLRVVKTKKKNFLDELFQVPFISEGGVIFHFWPLWPPRLWPNHKIWWFCAPRLVMTDHGLHPEQIFN